MQTTLKQPKPITPKSRYALFLGNFVDPVDPVPHPKSLDTVVYEWLESIGSDREKHSQSDSYLRHSHSSDGSPVPRKLTKSAPIMSSKRDAEGYVVPETPPSTRNLVGADTEPVTPSNITSSARSSSRSLVEDPLYRDANLAENGIFMLSSYDELFPEHVARLVDEMSKDRDSPGPSLDELRRETALYDLEMGSAEGDVEKYFQKSVFPNPTLSSDSLKTSLRLPMGKHTVPNTGSKFKVSNPVPDMLYGYKRHGTFTRAQEAQFNSMGNTMMANSQNLAYPFFVIEFKGDGPSEAGSLWAAASQCLGGSTSCVHITERLNHQLAQVAVQPVNSAAFSIAMSGTEARLYISWKHNESDYYMRKVDSFLLQKLNHYLEFRKYVRNIIDWGKGKRLKEIQDALDSLLEQSKTSAFEVARSRQPSSHDSATSSSKRQKSSSSPGKSTRSSSVQGQGGRAKELY